MMELHHSHTQYIHNLTMVSHTSPVLVIFWVLCIFLIAAVTSFLSFILNIRTFPILYFFSLSLEKFPTSSRTITSKTSSGRNRKRSTLNSYRALLVLVSISRTSALCFSRDSFAFRSFYHRNHTCSSPSVSAMEGERAQGRCH